MSRIGRFAKKEPVLCAAFLCALVSCLFVHPSAAYLDYIDFSVLILLFCLMAAVGGLRISGFLHWVTQRLASSIRTVRGALLVLVLLPFFASMALTNDVALLAFVPFAALTLEVLNRRDLLATTVVLQAVAANLGGMLLPMGNPQNLFIYARYELGFGQFVAVLAPFVAVTLVALVAVCLAIGGHQRASMEPATKAHVSKRLLALYCALFGLCLLGVLRIIPHWLLLLAVVLALLIFDKKGFRQVDYGLLATFVCFFILSGNLANSPAIVAALGEMVAHHTFAASVLASQVISNVPAAVLLSSFTTNWSGLLLGVDLGGLGTPIASLASLIAYRLYMKTPGASNRRFFARFAIANAAGLVVMVGMFYALVGAGLL